MKKSELQIVGKVPSPPDQASDSNKKSEVSCDRGPLFYRYESDGSGGLRSLRRVPSTTHTPTIIVSAGSVTPSIVVGVSEEGEKARMEESGVPIGPYKVSESYKNSVLKTSYSDGVVKIEYLVSGRTPLISLVRGSSGSYTLSGLEGVNLFHSQRLREILKIIKSVSKELESINIRGFVTSTHLSDYPIMKDYLKEYVKADPRHKGGSSLKSLDSRLTLREKRVLVGWLHTLFSLNMYTLILGVLHRLGVGQSKSKLLEVLESSNLSGSEKELVHDLILDLQTLSFKFYGGINASVREAIRQGGLTVTENTYCGFDTEYQNEEMGVNKILSAQWAVNSRIILTMPFLTDYELSNQNTQSGEAYRLNPMWFKQGKMNFFALQSSIRGYIREIRELRFSQNDDSIKRITHSIIQDGTPYFIEKGKINFVLGSRSPIKTYFKTDNLDKLDLNSLVQIGLNLDSEFMDGRRNRLKAILKNLNVLPSVAPCSLSELPLSKTDKLPQSGGSIEEITDSALESKSPTFYKGPSSRTYKGGFTSEPISLTTRRNFYIIGHLTQADLSLLSDFAEFKRELDIVNKCMVTLGKSSIVKHGHNIIFRDTLLLAPGGKKSLASIGSMYGDHLRKISLSESQHQNMAALLKDDPNLFKNYALRDSLISLVHAQTLEDEAFKLNKLGIPLSLSSLGGINLGHFWNKVGYKGYQISKDYLIGDSRKVPTPKGLFMLGNIGLYLNNYIASYKGGRNESFMIGTDTKSKWYDNDLTSAYTSAMAMLGDPNYDLAIRLSPTEIGEMTEYELLYSYTTIELKSFVFPESVSYPSIPCYADETTTVYPRRGKGIITGIEYLAALKQGCEMSITGGTLIPFRLKDNLPFDKLSDEASDWDLYKRRAFAPLSVRDKPLSEIFKDMPFSGVISSLQAERRKHLKGTIQNLLYKEMGNCLYGSVTKGINHKVKFDIKTNRTIRMESNEISNPIIASWITGYVRSLLGELLHRIDISGGKVVSVTTDGFITDIPDLENSLLGSIKASEFSLLKEYRSIREHLSGNPSGLEVKNEKRGFSNLMSWTTRGQLSVDMGIKAITGLQTSWDLKENWDLMSTVGLGGTINFASRSLRSALDVYKQGGHVTMSYRDQDFRIAYNNNRVILDDSKSEGFLSSRPIESIEEALTLRRYSQLPRSSVYQKNTSQKTNSKYTSILEIGIRAFLKALLAGHSGLTMTSFSGYRDIIDYVHKFVYSSGWNLRRGLDSSYISQLKMRQKDKTQKPYQVPRHPCILSFFDYVKERFKDFDTSLILSKDS
jgi:hypothetical protein